jgi:thioredoxin 1
MSKTQPESLGAVDHHAIEVTRDDFATAILVSPLPVLVDFWGPRCIPCMELLPVVEQLAETYQGRLRVAKVNVAQNRRLCIERRVQLLPTFLFFRNGDEVMRLAEETTAEQLRDAVSTFLEGSSE